VAVVLVVAAIAATALWPEATEVDVTHVERGPMQVTIDEEGETRVRDRFVVSAPVAGRLERIELEPGDPVVRSKTIVARLAPAEAPLLDPRDRAYAEELDGDEREVVVSTVARYRRPDRLGVGDPLPDLAAARLDDGTPAGSVQTMDRVFACLVAQCGIDLVRAAEMCSTTPARELGLVGHGVIAKGAIADLTVLDERLRVVQTFIAGRRVLGSGNLREFS